MSLKLADPGLAHRIFGEFVDRIVASYSVKKLEEEQIAKLSGDFLEAAAVDRYGSTDDRERLRLYLSDISVTIGLFLNKNSVLEKQVERFLLTPLTQKQWELALEAEAAGDFSNAIWSCYDVLESYCCVLKSEGLEKLSCQALERWNEIIDKNISVNRDDILKILGYQIMRTGSAFLKDITTSKLCVILEQWAKTNPQAAVIAATNIEEDLFNLPEQFINKLNAFVPMLANSSRIPEPG